MIVYSIKKTGTTFFLTSNVGPCSQNLDHRTLLNSLLYSGNTRYPLSALRAFWDLDESVSLIVDSLPDSVRDSLHKTRKAYWDAYKLFYIPGKMFSINKNHEEITIYDLSQYYPEDDEPAAIEQLSCKAADLLAAITDMGMSVPDKLTSPVAIAESAGLVSEWEKAIPTIFDAQPEHLSAYEMAAWCTPREWVSAFQVGHWEAGELFEYDLTSAYPAVASLLPDLRDLLVWHSDHIGSKEESSLFGFAEGDLCIDPKHPKVFCSPVLVDRGDGHYTNATGKLPTDVYPLDQIRFIGNTGMGEFKLRQGWFFAHQPGVKLRAPFMDMVNSLYAGRSQSTIASLFLKRVMNGIIGRLLETRKKADGSIAEYGHLYNPIYHALITSSTKVRLARFILNSGIQADQLVHIGVDGFRSTCDLVLPSASSRPGRWTKKQPHGTVILSPGRIITDSRPKKGTVYRVLRAMMTGQPAASRYSIGNLVVDLNELPANQNRIFSKLPRRGDAFLTGQWVSAPVIF